MSDEKQANYSPEFRFPIFTIRKDVPFSPIDTPAVTLNSALLSGVISLITATTQNTLDSTTYSPLSTFTKHGKTIIFLTTAGTAFTLGHAVSNNLRGKNDAFNDFNGGALSGALVGCLVKSIPKTFGYAIGFGLAAGVTSWAGGFQGLGSDSLFSHETRKILDSINGVENNQSSIYDVVTRRPLSLTLEQLGVGRGINDIRPKKNEE
ncbi:uncharacterized protein ASCRUDRAFT_78492 [Ascoidea rubescens DSM 1968]|uniref:Uncharacterized protein n=1 Tax=Ascoidea rubescens DSM 1968 TaxID=1344418 RepID=A0A1D2VP38_9ASCO|nr:hypothetical protein ASCRUDRAFT_78492 [Ascoidea rubescens DSM 1968]ODV63368.1 hypothetical protein ASCRUDRAFT_78492 [Ascoidea rubescens DSM 1968]